MLVDVALQVVINLLLQHGWAGVSKHPNRDLAGVFVPTLDIYEDFDVARLAVAGDDAGNRQVR